MNPKQSSLIAIADIGFWLLALLALPHFGLGDDQPLKILALHGAWSTPDYFASSQSMQDLEEALPEYEFVYAPGGYQSRYGPNFLLWLPNYRTFEPDVGDESLAILDEIVEEQGPFAAILGYSQGAAMVTIYLAHAQQQGKQPFERAAMFCGYVEQGHKGIMDELIFAESPYGDVTSLHFIGGMDTVIPPPRSTKMATLYTDPSVIVDPFRGHDVPESDTLTFGDVVSFLRADECQDDFTIRFGTNQLSCYWVRDDPSQRCSEFYRGSRYAEYCPRSCNECGDERV